MFKYKESDFTKECRTLLTNCIALEWKQKLIRSDKSNETIKIWLMKWLKKFRKIMTRVWNQRQILRNWKGFLPAYGLEELSSLADLWLDN